MNLDEILEESGSFNTACSKDNRRRWKKTCDEFDDDLYREIQPKKSYSKKKKKRIHAPGQMTMSGEKLSDRKIYSAKTYSKAGVKVSISSDFCAVIYMPARLSNFSFLQINILIRVHTI